MQAKYSIKDLENLAGIKAHTLRAWEQRYGLIEPKRTGTNRRFYDDENLRKLLNIAVLVKSGIRISQVARMDEKDIRSAVIDASRYKGNYESQVNALKIAMIEYDEHLFDSIFNRSVIQFGLEETFSKIIGNFIHQVGILWQTQAVNVSNEHFISNLIRQKLFSVIDQTMTPRPSAHSHSYVLYLPSKEMHELGLLYLYYYLKKHGHRVIYLGQSVPVEYLKEVAQKTKVDYFVSIFTTQPQFEEIDHYFQRISEMFHPDNHRFLLTGMRLRQCNPGIIPSNVKTVVDLEALKQSVA